MPAFRNASTIGNALASIARQTLVPREVLVVDDGSDDHTFEAACAAKSAMSGITLKVLRQQNEGPGAARNRALHESSSATIAFLDADDEWLPTKLARSMTILSETGSDMVAHDYVAVTTAGEQPVDCTRHFRGYPDPFVGQLLRGYISSTTVVARRATVFASGGFDPGLPAGQDYDLWLAILAKPGVRFTMFPEVLSRYRIGPSGITGKVEQRRRCAMAILKRCAPLLKGRLQGGRGIVIERALIIHLQAAQAHLAQRAPISAASVLARAPLAAVEALIATQKPIQPRSDFLAGVAPEIIGSWQAYAG